MSTAPSTRTCAASMVSRDTPPSSTETSTTSRTTRVAASTMIWKSSPTRTSPSCGPANLDLCDATQKKAIEEAQAMSDADLDAKIAAEEKKMEDAESNFKSEVEKLQATYEKLSKEKDETIANVKKSGLGVLKSVKANKKK